MKSFRLSLLLAILCFGGLVKSQSQFYINALNGNVITCANPTVFLQAMHSLTVSSNSFSWTGPGSLSGNGTSFMAPVPGLYYLKVNTAGGFFADSLAVSINTTVPTSAVSPTLQNITCNPLTIQSESLTAIMPTQNITHHILSGAGGPLSFVTPTAIVNLQSAGVFTYVLVDNTNGCSTSKTFTHVSSQGYPTFSLTSPQNFTLGCFAKGVATLAIINAQTTTSNQIPNGGPVTFTLLYPGSSGNISMGGALSAMSVYSLNTPGTYTVVVRDNNTFCDTRVPVSVIINTVAPVLAGINGLGNQVISCAQPNTTLNAISTAGNTSFLWTLPGNPPATIAAASVVVSANFTVPATQTLIGTYTLTLTDPNNLCITNTMISLYRNIYQPNVLVAATPTAFTCSTPTIVLTNQSSTGIPANSIFPRNLPVAGLQWMGPSPQQPATLSATYLALTAGVYTLVARDLNNGCTGTRTIALADNRDYPLLTGTNLYTISCPGGTATLTPLVSGQGAFTYTWTTPANAVIANPTAASIIVNSPGDYTLTVTNSQNSCTTKAMYGVWACVGINEYKQNLKVKVYPNPGNGLFHVECENQAEYLKARVYNVLGEVVLERTIKGDDNSINLDAASGIYYLKIESAVTEKTIKLVKE